MTSTRGIRARWTGGALALLLGGCNFALDPASIVRTPRTLGIAAEPPELPMRFELAPEGPPVVELESDLELTALSFAPDGGADLSRSRPLRHRFRACLDSRRILAVNGLPGGNEDRPCPLLPGSPQEGTVEPSIRVDRAWLTTQLLAGLAGLAGGAGAGAGAGAPGIGDLDVALLLEVGIAIEVQHDLLDDSGTVLLESSKRVAFTTRSRRDGDLCCGVGIGPTTNPPFPAFYFGEVAVTAVPGSLDCMRWDGLPLTVPVATEVVLAPLPDDDWWQETFPVYDYGGGLVLGEENAYYSWYATAGALDPELTSPPDRATTWTAPEEPGYQRLFVVLRDGHLGTSMCSFRVTVTE